MPIYLEGYAFGAFDTLGLCSEQSSWPHAPKQQVTRHLASEVLCAARPKSATPTQLLILSRSNQKGKPATP